MPNYYPESAAHLRRIWDYLRGSFWPVPAAMLCASFAAAPLMLALDARYAGRLPPLTRFVDVSDAQAARALLGILSTSLATIAGVTFSVMVVALVLAASQYGPRVIRLFMRDRANQFALGALLGSFSYCVMVMAAVGGPEARVALPRLSLSAAVAVSLSAVLVWTFFIHHVARLLQSEVIAAGIHRDFEEAVRAMVEDGGGARVEVEPPASEPALLRAGADGYVQAVDRRALVRAARREGALIRLLRRPGHFVRRRDVVAEVWPAQKAQRLRRDLAAALALGKQRTYAEDLEYAADQLVQMAVRALSPGINDFFTAEACVDWLSAGLQRLAGHGDNGAVIADRDGTPRLALPPWRAHRVVAAAIDPIREAARGNVAVTIRLIEAVKAVATCATSPSVLQELARQADMLERGLADVPERQDRRDAGRRLSAVRRTLRDGPYARGPR